MGAMSSSQIRRLGAFAIDTTLVGLSTLALLPIVQSLLQDVRSLPLAALPGVLALGFLEGIDGRSPGKRVLSLKVVSDPQAITVPRAMVRELIKFLSLPILVLPILYAATWLQGQKLPYDSFLGLKVSEPDRAIPD